MQLQAPKQEIDRVVLIARDYATGRSKSVTIYNTTPDQVINEFKRAIAGPTQPSGEDVAAGEGIGRVGMKGTADRHPAPARSAGDTRTGANATGAQ